MTGSLFWALLVIPAAESDASGVRSTIERSVMVVRHGAGQPRLAPTEPDSQEFGLRQRQLMMFARLANLGLIHIRPVEADRRGDDPPWKYTPKRYHGYHPKPTWRHHDRPGWRYDPVSGWRHLPEPRWLHRPGALDTLLAQLPTQGPNWYVTKWR